MSGMVASDVDVSELIDSVPDPACEWSATGSGFAGRQADPCGEPPAWLMIVSCGCSAYFCQAHADATKHRLRGVGLTVCTTHDNRRVVIEWVAL